MLDQAPGSVAAFAGSRKAGSNVIRRIGLFLLPALALFAQDADLDASRSELRPYIERYSSDRGNVMRTFSIDASAAHKARWRKFYSDWRARLNGINFNSLSQDGKVDYVAFRRHLDHELKRMDLEAAEDAETASYKEFAPVIVGLEEARRRMEPVNSKEAAATLSQLMKRIEEARRTVEGMLSSDNSPEAQRKRRIVGNRAATEVTALRNMLRGWFGFYNGYDPVFTWWSEEPYRAVDSALQNYATFLRERVAGLRPVAGAGAQEAAVPVGRGGGGGGGGRGGGGGFGGGALGGRGGAGFSPTAAARAGETGDIIGNPIGREGLMAELAYEMIPYTPEELIAIAEKEFAWCENEMKRASREMGFGDDWKKALEKVKNMHVEPGKQPEVIRDLAREAEKFLDDHDLITVPPLARETWRMEMMSAERQLVNPFFTGGEVITVSFPTNTMTYEQRLMSLRGNNIPMSRATVFHELIPGHHLQGFMGQRYKPYRGAVGGTPFITEGWALYWELLLYDMKFQRTPEDRVGALFWRMHRCARIIFSLSFHLGKMTPDECISLLVDRVGHERENATGEVRRSFGGSYGPLYQAAYLLGGMQLYALRKELVDSGKMTNRQFHDAILRENRVPVELIRASLAKLPLTRDYSTTWKFHGPVEAK
ncbi:MAG: DUF885 family protein [Bryobacteraceae bacterium]